MSEHTHISYCDHTKSPWRGCEKKSSGCAGCYVEGFQRKFGDKLSDRRLVKSFESDAKRWNKRAGLQCGCGDCDPCCGGRPDQCAITTVRRHRVFVSLCDWLDDKVPVGWLAYFLQVIRETPNLDWLVCTKRPENWRKRLEQIENHDPASVSSEWLEGNPPANVWFGVTCEDQAAADERIPLLLQIPARVRWVSFEPLLGPIDLAGKLSGIDWAVVGAQSGPKRRDCGLNAILKVAYDCRSASVPCFVKQDCALRPGTQGRIPDAYWSIKQFPRSNGAGLLEPHGD